MAFNNSPLSFDGLRELCDRALAAPSGDFVKITTKSKSAAKSFRQRVYALRSYDRGQSLKIYEPGDPRHGRSPYDALIVNVEGEVVLMMKGGFEHLKVETVRAEP